MTPKKPIFEDDEIVIFTNDERMIVNNDLEFIDLCSKSI
jgi:hypothetical protein